MYIVAVISIAVNLGQKKRATVALFCQQLKIISESEFANWDHNA